MFKFLRNISSLAVLIAGASFTQVSATTIDAPFDEVYRAGATENHTQTRSLFGNPYVVFAYGNFSTAGGTDAMLIQRANTGWGVSNISGSSDFEAGRIGGGEALLLDFLSLEVTLETIGFSTFDAATNPNDDGVVQLFDLYVRALNSSTFTKVLSAEAANDPDGDGIGSVGNNQLYDVTSSPAGPITGTAFALVSLNEGAGSQGFRLSSFSGTAAIPLPGTAAALGGGLLLGGIALRRRKARS